MTFTVRYSSTRTEIWRTYWRAWGRPRGWWRVHLALSVVVGGSVSLLLPDQGLLPLLGSCGVVLTVCLVVFPLVPQLKFKPAERELTIDGSGWKTRIGALSGSRVWRDVRSIEDTGSAIEITGVNGNVIIVPWRAFRDAQARSEFLHAAIAWHASGTTA